MEHRNAFISSSGRGITVSLCNKSYGGRKEAKGYMLFCGVRHKLTLRPLNLTNEIQLEGKV
jgi:hypothetical protein